MLNQLFKLLINRSKSQPIYIRLLRTITKLLYLFFYILDSIYLLKILHIINHSNMKEWRRIGFIFRLLGLLSHLLWHLINMISFKKNIRFIQILKIHSLSMLCDLVPAIWGSKITFLENSQLLSSMINISDGWSGFFGTISGILECYTITEIFNEDNFDLLIN